MRGRKSRARWQSGVFCAIYPPTVFLCSTTYTKIKLLSLIKVRKSFFFFSLIRILCTLNTFSQSTSGTRGQGPSSINTSLSHRLLMPVVVAHFLFLFFFLHINTHFSMTLEPSCAHGTTPRQRGLDSLTCTIIFDESPLKACRRREIVKLYNSSEQRSIQKHVWHKHSKYMTQTPKMQLPRTWLYLKCSSQNVLDVLYSIQKHYHDKKNPKTPAVHDLWMNKQLLTQKCSWVQERGMFPVWMVIHVKGNHKMTMFPLSRFSVEAACAHRQTGNMQTSGQKKRVFLEIKYEKH